MKIKDALEQITGRKVPPYKPPLPVSQRRILRAMIHQAGDELSKSESDPETHVNQV